MLNIEEHGAAEDSPSPIPLPHSIILAFLVGFLTDFVWAKLVEAIGADNAFMAANWSTALYLCGTYATHLMIRADYWAIAAFALGGWVGTFLCVWWGRS
jgi:hypothetical protein